jgi:fructose-1,6-bisphosphatase/inositol monophosphatase family enzyme
MALWDVAALQPILEEAGGVLTDWQGNSTIYSDEAVATGKQLLEQVVAITREG